MTTPPVSAEKVREAAGKLRDAAGVAISEGYWMTSEIDEVVAEHESALDSLLSELASLKDALGGEFFRILPDLDYEQMIPGSDQYDGAECIDSGVYRWAWETHPWKALLGITDEECLTYIRGSVSERKRVPAASRVSLGER